MELSVDDSFLPFFLSGRRSNAKVWYFSYNYGLIQAVKRPIGLSQPHKFTGRAKGAEKKAIKGEKSQNFDHKFALARNFKKRLKVIERPLMMEQLD